MYFFSYIFISNIMDQVNLLKYILIFDFYNNLANKKQHSFKLKSPNRVKILNHFEDLTTDTNCIESRDIKPNDLKYNNNKLFNNLLNAIYKKIDNVSSHAKLKNNINSDLKINKIDNIYNLAYDWCFFQYFVNL